jgi:hypothetical protein
LRMVPVVTYGCVRLLLLYMLVQTLQTARHFPERAPNFQISARRK